MKKKGSEEVVRKGRRQKMDGMRDKERMEEERQEDPRQKKERKQKKRKEEKRRQKKGME